MTKFTTTPAPKTSSYTPGPWHLGVRSGNTFQIRHADEVLAFTCGENCEANARLIAAAPALIEALEDVLEALWVDDLDEEQMAAVDKADDIMNAVCGRA
jgi:hypothetical protein